MNPYETCPEIATKHFIIRLIRQSDSASLFDCYHDKAAVALMNDDNCDFGFYTETPEQMAETIAYWLDFYEKRYFVRFAIVDCATGKAVGTIEGFGGETGVLRIDIAGDYEKAAYLSEIIAFAQGHFYEYFGNSRLVTKAVSGATQRRKALEENGWKYIDEFRGFKDYYEACLAV